MSRFSASPEDFVEVTLTGYVVYNVGGFVGITNDVDVARRHRSGDATFDRDEGEYYFDIPEHMITSVEQGHPYPDGTIARIILPPSGLTMVCEYWSAKSETNPLKGTTHWYQANSPIPVWVTEHCKVEVIWNPEEDG